MLTVEQVRSLDEKVRQALELIESLKSENNMLKSKLDEYKQRVDQLESVVDGFKLEQLEIEEGIKDVLNQLDQLEDQITAPPSSPAAAELPSEKEPEVTVTAAPEELNAAGIETAPVQQQAEVSRVAEQQNDADDSSEQHLELEIF